MLAILNFVAGDLITLDGTIGDGSERGFGRLANGIIIMRQKRLRPCERNPCKVEIIAPFGGDSL